jgi:hypothetical protein
MRVFLSWSGERSRRVATALHDWLPLVVQAARPFVSTGDIAKGRRWSEAIGHELNTSAYGIICITRENRAAPWLHFEAGAISKALEHAYVSPLLFQIKPSEIDGPLQQFQLTQCEKDDIWSLVRSINSRVAEEEQMTEHLLWQEFAMWWPTLEQGLNEIAALPDDTTHTAYEWLFTADDLARVHTSPGRTCVWWVTPNPVDYVLTDPLRDVVRAAVERGVTYRFLVPADSTDDAYAELRQLGGNRPDLLEVVTIPREEFHQAAVTDYIVAEAGGHPEVYLELPLDTQRFGLAPGTRGFWMGVSPKSAGGFAARFKQLADRHRAPKAAAARGAQGSL